MSLLPLDELNVNKRRSIPYEEYFGDMDIPKEDKERRIELAKVFENVFTFVLTMIALEITLKNDIDIEYYVNDLKNRFLEAIRSRGIDGEKYEEYFDGYSKTLAREVIDATLTETKEVKSEYALSMDRVYYISENEANSVYNYVALVEAMEKGYTRKMWVSHLDNRTRHSHIVANGQTKQIDEYFEIGETLMIAPKVFVEGFEDARESVNCRCVLHYLR